jgi:hypothetical protein
MKKVFKVKSLFDDSVSLFYDKTGEKLTKKEIIRLRQKESQKKQTKINFQ